MTGKMGRGGGIVATNNGSSIVSCFNTEDIRVTATGSGSSDARNARATLSEPIIAVIARLALLFDRVDNR